MKIDITKLLQYYCNTYFGNKSSVLFSRWEDEVKKEIPIPECLMKDSSKYTDEDIAVIKLYKSKVQVLRKEREKYKSTLQVEIVETKGQLKHLNE